MAEQKLADFLTSLMAASANCTLYSAQHPIVTEYAERAFRRLNDLYAEDTLGLTVIGDSLLYNNAPVGERGGHIDTFSRRLTKRGIEKIEFRRGVTPEEFRTFISVMAGRGTPLSSSHIALGIVEVRSSAEGLNLRTLIEDNIARIRKTFDGLGDTALMDIRNLEESVVGLLAAVKSESNVLGLLSPVRNHDEYTYVHAANVSLLTLYQAGRLGVAEEVVCDIGLAGLLHDVGKIFVPRDILRKRSALNQEEWEQMKLHPVHGARYLSGLPDIPKIAMIAAYEHHLKYDGSGYPLSAAGGAAPHMVSQMVSIADFFDALRTERPYRKPVATEEILRLLQAVAGRDFNPLLVGIFVAGLSDARAAC